jgi:hypothetical protein
MCKECCKKQAAVVYRQPEEPNTLMRPVQKLQYSKMTKKEYLEHYAKYIKERVKKFRIFKKKKEKDERQWDATLKDLVGKSMEEKGRVILRPPLGKDLFCCIECTERMNQVTMQNELDLQEWRLHSGKWTETVTHCFCFTERIERQD